MTAGGTRLWELWHFLPGDTDEENGKRIGLFSTEALAWETMDQLRRKPGFRDNPAGFAVHDVVVDRVGWVDGFGDEG